MTCKKPFIMSLAVVMFIVFPALVTASAADKPIRPAFSLVGRAENRPAGQENRPYQEEKISPLKPFVLMDLGIASLKDASASSLRTSSSGFTFGLGGGIVIFKFFDIGVGFGIVFLKDKDPFTNLTTGGEKSSSVAPVFYYLQAGVQVPIPFKNKRGLFPLWIGAHEGVMGVSATREIGNCVDCDKEKLSFIGRTYFQPEIKIQVARDVFVGAAYSIFCRCSDFKNKITLFFGGNFSQAN
ncbi:MAG: hypothetical protein NTV82_12150 [Candidatus Aminicenantes bacterium]|nr:hypothetical protein [Candidatus Aminicenantes bacterium]